MGNYSNQLSLFIKVVKKDEEKEILKKKLIDLCDYDYNGRNGEDYFVKDGRKLVSKFDKKWKKVEKLSTVEIIRKILEDNYNDDYYRNYKLELTEVGEDIVISLAYIS